MYFRDQTHLVNLDKHLTLWFGLTLDPVVFGRKVSDVGVFSESTAPVLVLNQRRTHFKHNRCIVSTFFGCFEYALLIVCRPCK